MEIEITIPSGLHDITLEQYQMLLTKIHEGDSEEVQALKTISILCKIPFSDVLHIKYRSIFGLTKKFEQIFKAQKELVPTFTLGGVEFGFIPELEEMSWGEYIDLENYLTDWFTMHKAMAVMYRPITGKDKRGNYEIEEYVSSANYSEVMKASPLNVVFGANVFFYALRKELLNASINYLQVQLDQKEIQTLVQELNLAESGVGINQYINSLKEILRDLTPLPNYHLYNV